MILKLFKIAFSDRHHRILLALALFLMCLLTLASQLEILAIGIITQQGRGSFALLDRIQEAWNQFFPISENFTNLAIFLVFVALFKAVTLFSQRYTTRLIAIRVSRDLRQAYFEHIQSLPMTFYQQHNIGSLSGRVVGDAALIAEAVNASLVNYIQTPFTILTTLVLCFLTSWELSLLVFFGLPLIIFPIVFLAKRVKRISKQIQQTQELFASALIDFVAGIHTVKVFAMEEFSLRKYRERNQQMANLEQKSARYDLASRPIVHTIGMTFLAVTILYGLYVLHMQVSEVLIFCGFLYLFYEPVKKFAEENSHIQRGFSAAERMQEVMEILPPIHEETNSSPILQFRESIEFKDVWFRYGDQWVLKGVSFKIQKGEMVALVGPTGAGKSSIVQLLPRLYEIEQGDILIDGQSIKSYTSRSLRELIAFVPQKPFLFLDTIEQNIAFGRPFTPQQIQGAAKKACAEEFILKMPLGYSTELLEGGKNLSGGQQQRLAIARALVKSAPLLVMDEATSSLDTVSEDQIKQAIQQLRGEITQVIIAHRLSTIEDADRIIYLENGVKVAEGTRNQLLQTCAGFKAMWDMMHRKGHHE